MFQLFMAMMLVALTTNNLGLLWVAAAFQLFDGLQVAAAGVLRGERYMEACAELLEHCRGSLIYDSVMRDNEEKLGRVDAGYARWLDGLLTYLKDAYGVADLPILDFGSGMGSLTVLMNSLGHRAIGTELQSEHLRIARILAEENGMNGDETFVLSRENRLPFDDDKPACPTGSPPRTTRAASAASRAATLLRFSVSPSLPPGIIRLNPAVVRPTFHPDAVPHRGPGRLRGFRSVPRPETAFGGEEALGILAGELRSLGMGMLLHVFARGLSGHFSKARHLAVKNVMLYWHFVDIVWIFLFPLFYLLGRHS